MLIFELCVYLHRYWLPSLLTGERHKRKLPLGWQEITFSYAQVLDNLKVKFPASKWDGNSYTLINPFFSPWLTANLNLSARIQLLLAAQALRHMQLVQALVQAAV